MTNPNALDSSALEVVLTPPQRNRLREVLETADLSGVRLTGEGWHRFAILAEDRVLLLPRSHRWVPGLEREAVALPLLTSYGIPVPRLLARIVDDELWPYPVTMITRYRARSWAALQDNVDLGRWQRTLTQLGELVASYHKINISEIPAAIGNPTPGSPDPMEAELRHFEDYLVESRLEKLSFDLAVAAELPATRVDRWLQVIEPCLVLQPTLTHRDINEGQIMINSDGDVCGLIDWESAGVQHPLSDFDFGEWGFGIWEHELEFSLLRKAFWDSYRNARGVDLPDWPPVHLLMTIIGAPPPEGHTTAWTAQRRNRTITNLRAIDAQI
ncbi:phosphotransferase family protein [Microlunatus elymi]|uniref:phosphotransferase family protein n=1 Tax=Microlunatus elymi TaxID=2596828 RepID=UPI00143D42C0|nr:phosphotransferase [Microlunatus elymi]